MKQSFKRFLSMLLCLSIVAGVWVMPLGIRAAGTLVNAGEGVVTDNPIEVTAGGTLSYRAKVNGNFDAFDFWMPTWGSTTSSCIISMYSWKGTYESTIASAPIVSKSFSPLVDNARNMVEIGTVQFAGEYLFHISDVQGRVGVYASTAEEAGAKGFIYKNGIESRFVPNMAVRFTEATIPAVPYLACKASSVSASPVRNSSGSAVSKFSSLGIRLNVSSEIAGIRLNMATGKTTDKEIDISVYRWTGSYIRTISESPLVTERISLVDNAYQGITFDKLSAGDYLFLADNWTDGDQSDDYVFYYYNTACEDYIGEIYHNGSMAGAGVYPMVEVIFAEEQDSGIYFLPCDEVSGEHDAPPEYTIPADSLLNTHTVMPDTWVFTDGLGRVSLTNAEVGDPKDDKTLAMFFWTWHGSGSSKRNNLQELSQQYPEAMQDYDHPIWGQLQGGYSWNESIYGFYSSTDEWVLRRQAELLTNAGVDVIFTDNTNGTDTWQSAYSALMKTWDTAQKTGAVDVPKVSFMLPFSASDDSKTQLSSIYLDIYRTNSYQNLWYYRDGKPLLMAHTDNLASTANNLEKEILNFFTFRRNYAGYNNKNPQAGSWGWLSIYPQAYYYANAADSTPEQISVGVAHNYNYRQNTMSAMNGNYITGRSYTSTGYHTEEGAKLWGYNFAEQFDYALEVDPSVVFVTGWNEWMVGRYELWPENNSAAVENAFPDQFNDEYSRDIEPSKGDLKDHYYYQLVNYARRYKGVRPIPTPSEMTRIELEADVGQWNAVEPYFAAYIGNTDDRNAQGYGQVYTETSGRNDIIGAQIARDDKYVYFHVECAEDITPYTDKLWMNLYLDTDQSNQGWNTFDYVLNKSAASADTLVLEKFTAENDYSETTKVADVKYIVNGRYLTVKIAKSDLGISGNDYTINFAWTDNVHDESDYSRFSGDIMDFYISGDVAPGGRFKYSYVSTAENAGTIEPEYSETDIMICDGTGTRGPIQVSDTVAYRVIVNSSFSGFAFYMPTYNTSDSECTISLYKWKGTYESTIASVPVKTRIFNSLVDNSWNWITFEPQNSGEYLFSISGVTGMVGIWNYASSDNPKGFIYKNGVEERGEPELKIRIAGEVAATPFGMCKKSAIPVSPAVNSTGEGNQMFESSVAVRMHVTAPFAGFKFKLANGGTANAKEIDFSVYSWNGTYEQTLSGSPVAFGRISMMNLKMQGIVFDQLPAGEYLFIADNWSCTDSTDKYVFYCYHSICDAFNGTVYDDGQIIESGVYPIIEVIFAEETDDGNYFLPILPETDVNVYDGTGNRVAVSVGDSISYRALINHTFTGFGFVMPTYTTSDSTCTISMYQWKGTYESTIVDMPVASQSFVSLKDGAINWVTFGAQPAGEYLFHISNATGRVGIWNYADSNSPQGFLYTNGVEKRGEPELRIRIAGEVSAIPFGKCSASYVPASPAINPAGSTPQQFDSSVGIRLNVTAPFAGFNFNMATGSDASRKEIDFSVYTWKGTYEATMAVAPVVTKRVTMKNNAYQGITFDALPAGDYLFLADNWSCADADDKWVFYYISTTCDTFEGVVFDDGEIASNGVYPQVEIIFATERDDTNYFASTDIHYRGYQVSTNMKEAEAFNIRFAATIDSLEYAKVGFEVTELTHDRTWISESSKVYTGLNAMSSDGNVLSSKILTAEELGGVFIVAMTIKGIPTGVELQFEIRPYVINTNGKKEYGAVWYLSVTTEGGISHVRA